jgi:hypothetical protein
MWPLELNLDPSATRSTLPQHGHFGRPRFSVARSFDNAWHADWMIIADPPRRSSPHPTIPILPGVYGVTATAA